MKPQRCELSAGDDRCNRPAVRFVMGKHVCAAHNPTGAPSCSHSLAPSGSCAYCGAVTS